VDTDEVVNQDDDGDNVADVAEVVNPPQANGPKPLRDWAKKVAEDNRRLRQMLAERDAQMPSEIVKPTLESVGFDEDAYAEKLLEWNEKQSKIKESKQQQIQSQQQSQEEWGRQVQKYQAEIAKLGADGSDAQEIVQSITNTNQQAIIVMHADNPAGFVSEIAKNETLLMQMAAIQDPLKLVKFITKTEASMKKPTQNKPAPEAGLQRTSSAGAAPKNIDVAVQKAQQNGNYDAALAAVRAERLRSQKK